MIVTVTFQWDDAHGPCYDCGKPSAFYLPFANPKRVEEPPTRYNKRCALCAACAASDDYEPIRRIQPLE